MFVADNQLIITGEWCHEVLAEYVLNPTPTAATATATQPVDQSAVASAAETGAADESEYVFQGRGVQYYLGYHHGQDSCR